jgi:DNA-binding transcriptional MerR regulator
MSPEILKRNEYNTKTDIYSIGLVIYQLSVICTSDKITKIYQGLLKNRNYVVEELEREKIPKILATIITNCLKIKPDERSNVNELLQIIHNYEVELYTVKTKKKSFSFKFFNKKEESSQSSTSLFNLFNSNNTDEEVDTRPLSSRSMNNNKILSESESLNKVYLKISDYIDDHIKNNPKFSSVLTNENNENNENENYPYNLSDVNLLEIIKFIIHSDKGFKLQDRKTFLHGFKNCFISDECVECLRSTNIQKRQIKQVLNLFVDIGLIKHVVDPYKNFKIGYYFYKFDTKKLSDVDHIIKTFHELKKYRQIYQNNKNYNNFDDFSDDLKKLINSFKDGVDIKDRVILGKTYKKSFFGSDAVSWLSNHYDIQKETSIKIGYYLIFFSIFENYSHPNQKFLKDDINVIYYWKI